MENEERLTSIVDDMMGSPCLRRVELGSVMNYIDQDCEITQETKSKIAVIQNKILDLGIVLVTKERLGGQVYIDILLTRKGISVSGSGLSIVYTTHKLPLNSEEIKCGSLISLKRTGWYTRKLSSDESNCKKRYSTPE